MALPRATLQRSALQAAASTRPTRGREAPRYGLERDLDEEQAAQGDVAGRAAWSMPTRNLQLISPVARITLTTIAPGLKNPLSAQWCFNLGRSAEELKQEHGRHHAPILLRRPHDPDLHHRHDHAH